MKTTVELPDHLLKKAKSLASTRGISLKQLIIEALSRLTADATAGTTHPAWLRCFGAFKDSADETAAIQRSIDAEFSVIDDTDWK
mgnify:CR=1 FL=1